MEKAITRGPEENQEHLFMVLHAFMVEIMRKE